METLWIPGPTHVRPELLAECTRPMIGHRSAAMSALIERLDPGLGRAFGLADGSGAHVGVAPCSATGMMEGSLLGVGERVLAIVGGAFGKRWHKIAGLLGKDVTALEVEWGRAVDPEVLAATLDREGPFDAVTMVSNETSTGVWTRIADVKRALASHPDTLLLADVVSLIGGAPVDFDAAGADFALAGVQKALALPPGITVFCASERYLAGARERPRRGFYLDPVAVLEGHEKRSTPATPCIPLYYALARQLDDIDAGATLPPADAQRRGADAWAARFEKHERMRARTLAWAEGHGLAPLPPPEACSPTVSCIRSARASGGDLDVAALVGGLAGRGLEISNGYGALKGRTFRIGHMGDHTEEGLETLLAAADDVLR